jgi:hypothetical protein
MKPTTEQTSHWELQRARSDRFFRAGARPHILNPDRVGSYLTPWRLRTAVQRLLRDSAGRITRMSSALVLCAADGHEGSVLSDLGFQDVTVSDISEVAVRVALDRDNRLTGRVLNAEDTGLAAGSYELVIIQDGLHHLQDPVGGFTEMLRISSCGVIFLEPHDSLIGRLIGKKWEVNDEARNYVFRWTKKLVGDVTASYLGSDAFENLSFSFCHHNVAFARLGRVLGNGSVALASIQALKSSMDFFFSGMGNQFCGMIVKKS